MSMHRGDRIDGPIRQKRLMSREGQGCRAKRVAYAVVPMWLAVTLSAWAQTPQQQAPSARSAPTCTATQVRARNDAYVRPTQVDMVALLPPPPAANSAAEQRDVAAVLDAQRAARVQHRVEHAIEDAKINCGHFADVLGAALDGASAAKALAFLNRAAQQGAALTGAPKRYWHRQRPYVVSARVERLADVSPNAPLAVTVRSACGPNAQLPSRAAAEEALARVSYPSGHSAYGTVCAILLADMVPEKRAELFERGRDYGHSRLVVGAHFPTDVAAGRTVGTVAVALMMQEPKFQRDYAAARAQLRAALGLSNAASSAAASAAPGGAAPALAAH
jgi:acid phosphatase (class A)